jgi:hypothetical protein
MKTEHISIYKLEVNRDELENLMYGLQAYRNHIRKHTESVSTADIQFLSDQIEELLGQ